MWKRYCSCVFLPFTRPAQLAELSRNEFYPELFSHNALFKFFCDIHDKSAIFNISRQNVTIFLYRKWIEREETKKKWGNVENESLSTPSSFSLEISISSSFSHSLSIFLHPRCKNAASCAALVVFSIRHKSQTRRRLLEIAKHVFDQSNKHKGSWQNWLSSWWLKKSSSTTHTGSFITEGLFGFQKLIFFSTNNGNFSNNHVSTSTSFILFFFDSLIQQ